MRSRVAVAGLVLALGAAGCSGGQEPEAGPTLPPVSEAPSETPEAVPSEAAEATPEGAAEFVRYFYETLERAYAEANPDLVSALSSPECSSCTKFIDSITDLRDNGGRVQAFTIDVVDVQAAAVDPASDTTSAVVVVDVSEYVRFEPDGSESAREPAASGAVNDLRLVRDGDSWLVKEISQ